MYTHKIISKEFENGVLVLGVEFTNGTTTITEAIKPQDMDGFKHWANSRLKSLNSLDELTALAEVGVTVDIAEPEPEAPTTEEVARNTWLEQWAIYTKANTAMKSLAEAGIDATPEEVTRFNTLKAWVGENRKPEYSQYI